MSTKTLRKEACPKCRESGKDTSGDNLAVFIDYKDNKTKKYCFACEYYENGNNDSFSNSIIDTSSIKYIDIADRGLKKETCEKYGIQIISYDGYFKALGGEVSKHRTAVFNYMDKGKIRKQKIRSMEVKQAMRILGDTKYSPLFGQQLFNPHPNLPIIITEGEWDAAAVWQETQLPTVSIPNGAQSLNCLTEQLEWLQKWKYIVLMFDQDDVGKEAVDKAIKVLPVGKVRVVENLPHKDANECVIKGVGSQLKSFIWNARPRKPESIVTISDIIDEVLVKPEWGIRLPWKFLDNACYGIQPNHLYSIIGGAKVGKTEFLKEIMFHLIETQDINLGIFSLEQEAKSTVQRLISGKFKKRLYLPDNTWWEKEKIKEEALKYDNKIHLYRVNSDEALSLDNLLISIRYMYYCYGIKVFILDNLTAMCHNTSIDGRQVSDNAFISYIMKKLFSLARELPISILLVVHIDSPNVSRKVHIPTSVENSANFLRLDMEEMLSKPGLDWDSGRVPGMGDVNKMVGRLSDYVIGLSRNIVSPDEVIQRTLNVKIVAARLASDYMGKSMKLLYEPSLGKYREISGDYCER